MESRTTVFVYGTLVHERTLAAVLGRNNNLPKYTPARLNNYSKRGLNIKENEGDWVQGYIFEASPEDMKKLNKYECIDDGMYKIINVTVEIDGGTREAIAYQMP